MSVTFEDCISLLNEPLSLCDKSGNIVARLPCLEKTTNLKPTFNIINNLAVNNTKIPVKQILLPNKPIIEFLKVKKFKTFIVSSKIEAQIIQSLLQFLNSDSVILFPDTDDLLYYNDGSIRGVKQLTQILE